MATFFRVSKHNRSLTEPEHSGSDTVDDTGHHDEPPVAIPDIAVNTGSVYGEARHSKGKGPGQSDPGNQRAANDTNDELQAEDDRVGGVDLVRIRGSGTSEAIHGSPKAGRDEGARGDDGDVKDGCVVPCASPARRWGCWHDNAVRGGAAHLSHAYYGQRELSR